MTVLSVNLNKIAVLRNARGGAEPSLARAADTCIAAGCGGITVHPRPDRRHITPEDVALLAELTRGRVEFNIEGNPFAPPRPGYPGMLELVRQARPAQATLVPDSDGQLTSDHGFDLVRDAPKLAPLVSELVATGCRVSLFVDAGSAEGFDRARDLGAARVELYTGPYARAFAEGDATDELSRCMDTARRAGIAGLAVNAGHDLNQQNLGAFRRAIPGLAEVSIGHALIGEALYEGLDRTVRNYVAILSRESGPSY
ncbi:MAG TPA: pyridoxine 5'-phosphate synthase [Rhodanobacteraceae bacterium]|jgi:pyridoxine 5-phosphate synthase|nr:pyridoxine 5'-phosphate synthase [Rhodanobacteraceae bacterium]